MSGSKRSRRIADVPIPVETGPPIQIRSKSSEKFEVGPTDDERWRSEISALIYSTDPDFYDTIRLAKSPLPPLKEAERILAAAAEPTEVDADIERLVAADVAKLAAAKATTTPVRFTVETLLSTGLAAGGDQHEIWRVTGPMWPSPMTAAADASPASSKPRRARPGTGASSGSSWPGSSAQGK